MEFLTNVTIVVPEGTLDATVENTQKPEAVPRRRISGPGSSAAAMETTATAPGVADLGLCRRG